MNFDFKNYIDISPYSLDKAEKEEFLLNSLKYLSELHYTRCNEYKKIIDTFDINIENIEKVNNIPFLPVRLFKEYKLLSVDKKEVIKTMTSSGTTGQQVSKIFLDKDNSTNQTKVLSKILSSFIGKKRLPMIILDTSDVVKNRTLFSARGAGILGFSMFGKNHIYAFDENMELDINGINDFLEKHKDENILIFGFTFIVWEHFYKKLRNLDTKIDLSKGILIHGGGWKKLISQQVSNDDFKRALEEICGVEKIYNYYGMVEQTGSIYMECEEGHLHASIFSDVIIRNSINFEELPNNKEGIIQVVSVLPNSYPGHSLLTEDIGIVLGEDDCKCGRLGKYFKVNGRIKNAEVRGCSDTYELEK